ncbi:MAG: hypothetical protein ABIC68_08780 [Candidatus Omnitrophota bacterium]
MFSKKLNKLPVPMADFIHLAGRVADEKGVNVCVVGGFVRDLFLGVANFDLDFVVEGDGIAFATDMAARLDLSLVIHRRFGTATLHGLEGFKVDIASSRREVYDKPAALPTVTFGKIEDDLFRRDFTINAMAIGINEHQFGRVIDYYNGLKDLKKGVIRALHQLSFIDDPTRILRAVRFEQRFGFKIEKETLSWIKKAQVKKMLFHVQKHRLRDELILIFKEAVPLRPLKRLNDLCGLSYIASTLRFQNNWSGDFKAIASNADVFSKLSVHHRRIEFYVMYMALFFFPLSVKSMKKVIIDFAFHKGESSRMLSFKESLKKVQGFLSRKELSASRVYHLLQPLSYEVIFLIMALSKSFIIKQRIKHFFLKSHLVRLHVKGEDLFALGIKPGPKYKMIFEKLLSAKIDGKLHDRQEELAWVQKIASGMGK